MCHCHYSEVTSVVCEGVWRGPCEAMRALQLQDLYSTCGMREYRIGAHTGKMGGTHDTESSDGAIARSLKMEENVGILVHGGPPPNQHHQQPGDRAMMLMQFWLHFML